MAVCPKCNRKLGLFDWSQNCPHCGVNMRFYNFEETFYREAKTAELSAAKVSIKIKRLKGAFIGGALPIACPCASVQLKSAVYGKDVCPERNRYVRNVYGPDVFFCSLHAGRSV